MLPPVATGTLFETLLQSLAVTCVRAAAGRCPFTRDAVHVVALVGDDEVQAADAARVEVGAELVEVVARRGSAYAVLLRSAASH